MYEEMTFEKIIERCLSRISPSMDKREGSVIYDAIAPAAAELAIMYTEIACMLDRAYPDTATKDDLTKKAQERGVFRSPATYAIRKGRFSQSDGTGCVIKIGARFSGGNINYVAAKQISPGEYEMRAEQPGTVGNEHVGTLFPIDADAFAPNFAVAMLEDILIPGEDDESDDDLRARYFESLESQAFGGNIADYKNKVNLIPGVGASKIIPVWAGGGTVKIIIISSSWHTPSPELILDVQHKIDPVNTHGAGDGLAPIGHIVTIVGVKAVSINVTFSLTFKSGISWNLAQAAVEEILQEYFDELAKSWANSDGLVVRISQLESKILSISGIIDITNTAINGFGKNITLSPDEIPVMGEITNET